MANATEITEAEVQKHATAKDLWMIIDGNVYDVTKFMDEHPGGADVLLEHGGTDASQAFQDVGHSADARELLTKFKVGKLQGGGGGNKFCFRIHKEEELSRNKSGISAKTSKSSIRRAVPQVSDPRNKYITDADPVRKKSDTLTPSCAKCQSCHRQATESRSKTELDSRTKSTTSTRTTSLTTKSAASIGKTVASRPSYHKELSKVKPITSKGSRVDSSRMKPIVSPKTSFRKAPSMTTAPSDISNRHKSCFVEPSQPWRTKSVTGHRNALSQTKSVTSERIPRPLPDVVTGTKSGSESVSETSVKPETVSRPIPEKTMPDPDPYFPPETSSVTDVWKYALVAIAGAVVVAVVLKKTGKI